MNKVFLLITLLLFISCIKDAPTQIEETLPYFEGEGVIDEFGGIVGIKDPGSPIYGAFVRIPVGALENKIPISLKIPEKTPNFEGDSSRIFVEFEPSGIKFKLPVVIGLPYKEKDSLKNVQGYFFEEKDSLWEMISFLDFDPKIKVVYSLTNHFSLFTTADTYPREINIADPNFEQTIRVMINKLDPDLPILYSDVVKITELGLAGLDIENLEGIQYFKNLQKFDLTYNQIKDISLLKKLTKLTALSLAYNKISEIKSLENLQDLTKLSLAHNQLDSRDLKYLKKLTKLEMLDLSHNNISEIKDLSKLENLEKLNLNKNQLVSLEPLKNLTKITELSFRNNLVSKLNHIESLTKLRSINLDSNSVSKLSSLNDFKHLESISACYNNLKDFPPVVAPKLKFLFLAGNKIKDSFTIFCYDSLRVLDLNNNRIKEFGYYLPEFPKLSILKIQSNNLEKLPELVNSPQITQIYASHNRISDLNIDGDIELHEKLQLLDLADNNLHSSSAARKDDLKYLSALTNLRALDLSNNDISSLLAIWSLTKINMLYLDSLKSLNLTELPRCEYYSVLSLNGNNLSNINLLLGLSGLDYGSILSLKDNPLNEEAKKTHIPILQAKGVNVIWKDDSNSKGVLNVSTDSISGKERSSNRNFIRRIN